MNPEQINKIVETIKTLNLNIDSQSAVEITQQLKPLLYFYMIKGVVLEVVGYASFVVAIYLITKAVRSYYKNNNN